MITCDVHEPADLGQAADMLRRLGAEARLMAGGTDLLVDLKTGRCAAAHIVSLHRVEGLAGIARGDGLTIGALTTIALLEHSPLLSGPFSILREAAGLMASPQIRHMATIGGNIASAVPCADLPPVLGVLDAAVVLWSHGSERSVLLTDFFTGPRTTVRRADEILTRITIPQPPPRFGASYQRFALREGNSIAVASVAASLALDGRGAVSRARIMLGAVAPVPRQALQAEEALAGRPLHEANDEAVALAVGAAQPISDLRGSAEYRRRLVGVLTRRALLAAHAQAMEDADD